MDNPQGANYCHLLSEWVYVTKLNILGFIWWYVMAHCDTIELQDFVFESYFLMQYELKMTLKISLFKIQWSATITNEGKVQVSF